jgi:hypothetical protein
MATNTTHGFGASRPCSAVSANLRGLLLGEWGVSTEQPEDELTERRSAQLGAIATIGGESELAEHAQ